jgi:hypothetical protein
MLIFAKGARSHDYGVIRPPSKTIQKSSDAT